ncbi:restriction endonuclease subunit S [Elizabethkingia anophelis]|uniref:restriction endonuclease subunit S n=1 Tax=Elizabethkingia anophelis TaxID=1117645 RepID=UPI001624714C|nr:restriction endonuclease subunit S [Elizabethkingia anophelis]
MTDIQKENKSGGKVPNLRFPSFEGEWEVKKLGEISTNKSKKYNPNNETNFIKCIELEHLSSETGQLLGFVDGSQSGSIKNVFQKGDVLFGKLRPYLKKYYQPNFDGVCSSEIWVLNGKEILNDFLYYLIQTNSFVDLANQSSGSKMPRADWSILENGLFSFPNSEEQQKIASFLSLIDERIQTQNKILIHLKSLIESLNDSLSEQKIRINSNFENWKKVRLGDLGYTFTGLSGKTKEDFGNGKRYIQYKQIFDSSKIAIENCGYVNVSENENQNSVKYGDIFFTISSETPDEIGMSSVLLEDVKNVYLNSFCFGFRLNSFNEMIPEFARFLFRSKVVRNEIKKLAQGSTRYNMSKTELLKLEILLPSIKEQKEISALLSSLDQKIQTEKAILEQLEMQKKYLLQQMFV